MASNDALLQQKTRTKMRKKQQIWRWHNQSAVQRFFVLELTERGVKGGGGGGGGSRNNNSLPVPFHFPIGLLLEHLTNFAVHREKMACMNCLYVQYRSNLIANLSLWLWLCESQTQKVMRHGKIRHSFSTCSQYRQVK